MEEVDGSSRANLSGGCAMVCVWDFAIEFEWGLCVEINVANEKVASHGQCAQRPTKAGFL